jgi:hypothetical protein
MLLPLFDNLTAQDSISGYVDSLLIEEKYDFPMEGSRTGLKTYLH